MLVEDIDSYTRIYVYLSKGCMIHNLAVTIGFTVVPDALFLIPSRKAQSHREVRGSKRVYIQGEYSSLRNLNP